MEKKPVVFWRRIFAFLIDFIIIILLGKGICMIFGKPIIAMGNWGELIGVLIVVLYYGISNSKIAWGQTLGKKLFKIKTIDLHGEYLSFPKSAIRALILFLPLILTNTLTDLSVKASFFYYFYNALLCTIQLSFITLLITNKTNRQSFHDIVLSTCVVDEDYTSDTKPSDISLVHITCLCLFAMLAFYMITSNDRQNDINSMVKINENLKQNYNIDITKFKIENNSSFGKVIFVDIRYPKTKDQMAQIKNVAREILQNYPEVNNANYITLRKNYRADIGITIRGLNMFFYETPENWAKIINNPEMKPQIELKRI